MQVFETDRFIIRRLENQDIEAFHDMQGNPNVMRFVKPTMNREESEQELARFIGYYVDYNIRFDIWAIDQKSSNEFVGICGVYENDQSESEIAYRLRESYWGKGIASEVTQGLIKYCFSHTNVKQLCAYVRLGNKGSIRILERVMNFVKQYYAEKGASDERFYSLNKDQWEAKRDRVITKVETEDAAALTALTIRSKAHWNYGADQINKWIPDLTLAEEYITEHIAYKLVDRDHILGYYSLIHISDSIIKMDNLFVEPDGIGLGYGAVLLNDSIQRAVSLGYSLMTLDADPHAEQFYLRNGFRIVGELPTSIEGRFLPVLEKEL